MSAHPIRIKTSEGWQDIASGALPGDSHVPIPSGADNGKWLRVAGGAAVWSPNPAIADVTGLQAALDGKHPKPTIGTTLPASPGDGQEAILVDNVSNPSWRWKFRYNAGSSSGYKWEYIGGYWARVYGGSHIFYNTWEFKAGSFQLPRSGQYDLMTSQRWCQSSAAEGSGYVAIGPADSGRGSAPYPVVESYATPNAYFNPGPAWWWGAELAAGTFVGLWGHGGPGNCSVADVMFYVTPFRVA